MFCSFLFAFFSCASDKTASDDAADSVVQTDTDSDSTETDTTTQGWQPDILCPGDDNCPTAEGALYAGVAALPITPICFESWLDCGEDGICPGDPDYVGPDAGESNSQYDKLNEDFMDCGCDRLCPGDEGYLAPDEGEADGEFQAVWLAGFSNGRAATDIHDDLWIRIVVLEQGETRIAFGVSDLFGWFYSEVVETREMLANDGVDLDHLALSSTHNHNAPDTLGQYGRTPTSGGYDEVYASYIRAQTVAAVKQAIDNLQQVGSLTVGSVDARNYTEKGTSNIVNDTRDPVVIDPTLSAALLKNVNGETIATLSHFGNHPETMGGSNTSLTSDFAGPLRDSLENGVVYDSYTREGYGGVSIFVNGAVGGMMTPLRITVTDGEGVDWTEYTFARNDALGKVKAEMAMDALDAGQEYTDIDISVTGKRIKLPVENWGFQAMFLTGIIERELFDYDVDEVLGEDNIPYVETELNHIQIGPLSLLTIPGEILPEMVIGGYDGSYVGDPNRQVVSPDNPNPPDLSTAPEGPYIKDMMSNEHKWIVGLGNDEIGYIIPEYNFKLHEFIPWFDQAEGDHYEETVSIGPDTASLLEAEIQKLLQWESD